METSEGRGTASLFYRWEGAVLVLNVYGIAGAKRDEIGKPRGNELKVSVTAAPENGKATARMAVFLAKAFGVAKKEVELTFGLTSPHKQFRIHHPKILPAGIVRDE